MHAGMAGIEPGPMGSAGMGQGGWVRMARKERRHG
jgi:hypothetical protein